MPPPTAPPSPSPLSASLLAWVKSFDEVSKIETLGDLNDGKALWAILQDIDPEYFSGHLPEPDIGKESEWTRKWQNLKHLEKQLSIYYRDVCDGLPLPGDGGGSGLDLKAIAASEQAGDVQSLERLIMEIIRAAMSSPESNQRMGKRLLGLGNEHAMAIAYEIRSMQDAEGMEEGDGEPGSRDESFAEQEEQEIVVERGKKMEVERNGNGAMFGDPLLEREEQLLKAQATIEKLQATHHDAQRQLQQLKLDKEQLQEAFDSYRSDINNRGRKAGADDDVKKLQRQADNDRAYIEDLETQLQSSRTTVDNYERQIQRLKEDHEAGQKLRDDLQVLKAENEDLNQKLKANENLKKKIQALQEQDKANASLREELRQANERLEELDRLKQIQAGLEKEIIEKKGLIRNQEYQITELTTTRKHAEYDARVLAQKLEAARERQERDHEAIEELRAKLQDAGPDDEIDLDPPQPRIEISDEDAPPKPAIKKPDESKAWQEKFALLEQQLEAADARLKQASARNATLEEQNRTQKPSTELSPKLTQQLEERESTIAELRKQLDLLHNKQQRKEQPPPQAKDLTALQRENQLMVSAWYDLSSRLFNNGVSLGRRRPEPRSWIGRQRALVGPGSAVGSGR